VQSHADATHTVCGGVVHRYRGRGDTNIPLGACRYVDVIVTGSVMRDVLEAGWQGGHQLFVEGTGHFGGVIRAVDGDNIVIFTTLQLGYKVLTGACAILLERLSVLPRTSSDTEKYLELEKRAKCFPFFACVCDFANEESRSVGHLGEVVFW
jgi:hypothetical protein